MRIITKPKNFTVVDNGFIANENLSLRAKGLLLMLLSKPDDWVANPKGLVKSNADGEISIRTAFQELQRNGYAKLRKYQNEKKQWVSEWVIYEHPSLNTPPDKEQQPNMDIAESAKPTFGSTEFGKPQPLLSTDILNTNQVNTNKVNTVCLLAAKTNIMLAINEGELIKQALNIKPNQENRYNLYIQYLIDSGMDLNKKNSIEFYRIGFNRQNEQQTKTTTKQPTNNKMYVAYARQVQIILQTSHYMYWKVRDDVRAGKIIYGLVQRNGATWVEQQLQRVMDSAKENISVYEQNIEQLLTNQDVVVI